MANLVLTAGVAAAGVAAPRVGEPGLPAEHVHVTQAGDTLIGLGRRYLADPHQWPQLQRLNQLPEPRRLPVGRSLRIPLHLMRMQPVSAAVLAVGGGVHSAGQALTAGQELPAGSVVLTDEQGSLTLRLVDGTLLRLRGGSRLQQTSQGVPGTDLVRPGVRLEQGRAEVQAKPARAGRPGFRIETPQGVLAVRGTEYRVAVDAQRSVAEVLEGAVALWALRREEGRHAAGQDGRQDDRRRARPEPGRRSAQGAAAPQGPLQIDAGFGAQVDAAGRVGAAQALLPAPDLSALPARHERPLVRLTLPPQGLAQSWRAQVAADDRFDVLLADVRADGPELRLAGLPDGRYALRVRAIDAHGLEGRDAVAALVLKARPEPPLLRAPTAGAVLRGDAVDLSWTANPEAARYRLQLARADVAEPFAAPLLDRQDLSTPGERASGLAPGAYLWRVAALRADGDAGPFGDAQAFELRELPPPPPRLQAAARSEAAGAQLAWTATRPGQRFELQLARDEGFADAVATTVVDHSRFEPALPGPGRYFVRMRVHEADGFVGPWSQAQYFDLADCVRDGAAACVRTEGGVLQRP